MHGKQKLKFVVHGNIDRALGVPEENCDDCALFELEFHERLSCGHAVRGRHR